MADVTRLPTRGSHAPGEVTTAELRSLLEWMGLSQAFLYKRLGITERTMIRWMNGDRPIPEEASIELVALWNRAADAIRTMIEIATAAAQGDLVTLYTYRTDEDYWADRPTDMPASWHRALTCRAMDHLLMQTRYQVVIKYHGEV